MLSKPMDFAVTNEHPAYKTLLPTFYMSKSSITQDIWEYVMEYNKSHFRHKGDSPFGNCPAEQLNYDEAQEFVRRLSKLTNILFSIPTGEEWGYDARGGQKNKGYIYVGSNDMLDVAWCHDNSGQTMHPIGQKLPNELGLYDMCGKVWEWTVTLAHQYGLLAFSGEKVYMHCGGSCCYEVNNCRVFRRYFRPLEETSGSELRVVIRGNV